MISSFYASGDAVCIAARQEWAAVCRLARSQSTRNEEGAKDNAGAFQSHIVNAPLAIFGLLSAVRLLCVSPVRVRLAFVTSL